MLATVSFDIEPFDNALASLADGLSDMSGGPMSAALGLSADLYLEETRIRYGQQSAGAGEWQPLSPRTRPNARPRLILIDTGTLEASFQPGDANAYRQNYPSGIAFGSTVPYGVYHQRGQGVPQRRVMVEAQRFAGLLDKMKSEIVAGVKTVARQAGLPVI